MVTDMLINNKKIIKDEDQNKNWSQKYNLN